MYFFRHTLAAFFPPLIALLFILRRLLFLHNNISSFASISASPYDTQPRPRLHAVAQPDAIIMLHAAEAAAADATPAIRA